MTQYVEYVTKEGDRWDQIAQRHYGDPYGYQRIIEANPAIPIVPLLPAGLRLAIPVIPPATTAAAALPPWKR
jgi:phage tail protein X